MKATEQYFPVVLFIMMYKVVLRFESVDEILNVTAKGYKGYMAYAIGGECCVCE